MSLRDSIAADKLRENGKLHYIGLNLRANQREADSGPSFRWDDAVAQSSSTFAPKSSPFSLNRTKARLSTAVTSKASASGRAVPS